MFRRVCLVLISLALVMPLLSFHAAAEAAESPVVSQAIISEVQLGGMAVDDGAGGSVEEYVELYNISGGSLDLSNWRLEYSKNDFDPASCRFDWRPLIGANQIITLSGSLPAGATSLPIALKLNNSGWGALRLVDEQNYIHDLVGWGETAKCFEAVPLRLSTDQLNFQRYLSCDGMTLVDTNDNSADFFATKIASPGVLSSIRLANCSQSELTSDCEGVIINEALPNPSGSDDGREFIELYNPTSRSINLQNCKLQTSDDMDELFVFTDEILKPGGYQAFYDTDTSLSLPNSSGGTVWLLNHKDTELHQVTYPADMDDDVSYALLKNEWKSTYIPTPGAENTLQATKPCPAGQYRSTETNRCRSSVMASALLKPCTPGKERNPATNRCRSTSSVLSTLKPCSSDQFRNPETNRCKKIGSGSSLKPCDLGEKRNPETNRCRKVAGAMAENALAEVKDVAAPSLSQNVSWMFAGASMVGAIGYAAFEWRKEFFSALANIKSKFTVSSD